MTTDETTQRTEKPDRSHDSAGFEQSVLVLTRETNGNMHIKLMGNPGDSLYAAAHAIMKVFQAIDDRETLKATSAHAVE